VKKKRTYNTRLVKATWPYTVQEIATLFGVHKNAPLRWLKEGLHANPDGRPYLIRGEELIRFLNERQQNKRYTCRPDEFFCFKCRVPRRAFEDIVDIAFESLTKMRVKGICTECITPVSKVQGVRKLHEIRKRFHVQKLEGQHMRECIEFSVNSDLEEET
jgi:hypothetical protein